MLSHAALSLTIAAQFLRYQKAFLLTTAAQNIHVFLRKSPLHKKHFFVWLKTANFSTACGTSTLKSPLLLGSDAPHVHLRLRKRLSRCTLDCGFKTSESPALRGFVAGPWALATAALYLVLLSNGLHLSKNFPVKFGFSPKPIPANIAKKLPPQRCSKLLFIAVFQLLPQTAHVCFHSRKWVHTRLSEKDRTQRLTRRNRWHPLPRPQHCLELSAKFFYSATLLYTYISRFPVNPQHQQKRIIRQSCHHKSYPQPLFNFSYKRPTFAFTSESGYALGSRRKIAHKGSHGETRSFTLVVALRFISHLTFGQAKAEGSGCTPTACVRFLRRRGPAGLCNTLFNLPICISHALRMGISAHARWKRYHYPRRTPHVVETPGARLSKRLIYRFLTVKQELLFARRLFSCE